MIELHKYDAGELGCGNGLPQEFRRQINSIPEGHVLEVTTRDPAAREDLPSLARLLGHEVISIKTDDNGSTIVAVKKHRSGPSGSVVLMQGKILNGLEVEQVKEDALEASKNPEKCAVTRKLHADWVGGTRARVYSEDKEIFVGGEGDFGAMSVALASLLACEIDVLATAATERGIEFLKLSIEGSGDFNYAKYVVGGKGPDPGFQRTEYTLKMKSKNATKAQLEALAKLCESSSPVRDTFARSVPISMKLQLD